MANQIQSLSWLIQTWNKSVLVIHVRKKQLRNPSPKNKNQEEWVWKGKRVGWQEISLRLSLCLLYGVRHEKNYYLEQRKTKKDNPTGHFGQQILDRTISPTGTS